MRKILTLSALLVLAAMLAFAIGCGEKTDDTADDTAQHSCVKCDMKMADADMVEKDGQWYCSHCAPGDADDHDHDHDHDHDDDHEGHDHG